MPILQVISCIGITADVTIETQGKNGKRRVKATILYRAFFNGLTGKTRSSLFRVPIPPRWNKINLSKIFAACIDCNCWLCCSSFSDGKTNIAFTGILIMPFVPVALMLLYQV
jgi:hypothetical protein